MKWQRTIKSTMFYSLMISQTFVMLASAQKQSRDGIYGDWIMTGDRRQRSIILSFTSDKEGKLRGYWIGYNGIDELEDVKFEEDKLSFTYKRPGLGDQILAATFTATVTGDKFAGELSTRLGPFPQKGQRIPCFPSVVGKWDMKLQMGEQEFTAILIAKMNKEGQITAQWNSERGEPEISKVQHDRDKLMFKMNSTNPDRPWEASFTGTVVGDTLAGKLKSERGEIKANGKRIGAHLIGTWNLDVSEREDMQKQRLKIAPDMTGFYNATPIKEVYYDDKKIRFTAIPFGNQKLEMKFEGEVTESKLVGEITTSRGTQKIAGMKVERIPRQSDSQ